VRILFDQGIPVPLRTRLQPHQIATVFEQGWSLCTNNELLANARKEGFDVFITTDQNHGIGENFSEPNIAIIVLSSTSWPKIQIATLSILQAIETSSPGKLHEVSIV